jgi:uncharacterized protein (TIGR03083 family)
MMSAIRVEAIDELTRAEAEQLASTEYERVTAQLRSLDAEDWTKQTECPLWTVRQMAGHTVGMMGDVTSLRNIMRRMRAATKAAKREGQAVVDCMTAMQVDELSALGTDELVARAAELGPRAARWRTHTMLVRPMPLKEEVGGQPEKWRMSYLLDVVLTRDPWMHRVDIARATGREMELTPEHDGRLVAHVVADWARRHGQPFTLTLTGPAGGEFVARGGGESGHLALDAVEFCRTLSGRQTATGLLAQEVPF